MENRVKLLLERIVEGTFLEAYGSPGRQIYTWPNLYKTGKLASYADTMGTVKDFLAEYEKFKMDSRLDSETGGDFVIPGISLVGRDVVQDVYSFNKLANEPENWIPGISGSSKTSYTIGKKDNYKKWYLIKFRDFVAKNDPNLWKSEDLIIRSVGLFWDSDGRGAFDGYDSAISLEDKIDLEKGIGPIDALAEVYPSLGLDADTKLVFIYYSGPGTGAGGWKGQFIPKGFQKSDGYPYLKHGGVKFSHAFGKTTNKDSASGVKAKVYDEDGMTIEGRALVFPIVVAMNFTLEFVDPRTTAVQKPSTPTPAKKPAQVPSQPAKSKTKKR